MLWLHHTGSLCLDRADELAPLFVKHGFALLVPTDKPANGWNGDQVDQLLKIDLPDVTTIAGVDAAKPLMYFVQPIYGRTSPTWYWLFWRTDITSRT